MNNQKENRENKKQIYHNRQKLSLNAPFASVLEG